MAEVDNPEQAAEWLKTLPESVRKLAAEFPLGMLLEGPNGEAWHLIGYTEDDMLIITPVNPGEDYDAAKEQRQRACASHYRPSPND